MVTFVLGLFLQLTRGQKHRELVNVLLQLHHLRIYKAESSLLSPVVLIIITSGVKKIKQGQKVLVLQKEINKILLRYDLLFGLSELVENNVGHFLCFECRLFLLDVVVHGVVVDHAVELLEIEICYVLSASRDHFKEELYFLSKVVVQHEEHNVDELLEVDAAIVVQVEDLENPIRHFNVGVQVE